MLFIECSAKANYNVKNLFRKLATSLPGGEGAGAGGGGGANNGGAGGGGGGANNSNLIDIKLSATPPNIDEAAGCGC